MKSRERQRDGQFFTVGKSDSRGSYTKYFHESTTKSRLARYSWQRVVRVAASTKGVSESASNVSRRWWSELYNALKNVAVDSIQQDRPAIDGTKQ